MRPLHNRRCKARGGHFAGRFHVVHILASFRRKDFLEADLKPIYQPRTEFEHISLVSE